MSGQSCLSTSKIKKKKSMADMKGSKKRRKGEKKRGGKEGHRKEKRKRGNNIKCKGHSIRS